MVRVHPGAPIVLDEMDPNYVEVLMLLMEECAEVIQAASKVNRFGASASRSDIENGATKSELLSREIGDLLGLIDAVYLSGLTSETTIRCYRKRKQARLRKYSSIPRAWTRGRKGGTR